MKAVDVELILHCTVLDDPKKFRAAIARRFLDSRLIVSGR